MVEVWLRCDMRTAEFGIPATRLAQLHLEQAEWADKHGFHSVQLPEHHGHPDGYVPSPMVLGGAIAARTERMRLNFFAMLLPLHDPVRVAEDAAVLDIISNGRVDLTIGVGYVPSEFAMFGVSLKDRAKRADAGLEVLQRAFAGEEFEYEGRPVTVRPTPSGKGPRIYVGGAVPASARRAARYGEGFSIATPDPAEAAKLVALYQSTCRELGKEPGTIIDGVSGHSFLYVTEDPDAAWQKIAPFALHETNMYAKSAALTGAATPYQVADDLDALKATGQFQVLTPEECIAYGKSLGARGALMLFNPTLCGMDEDFSWASLQLFAEKVLPHLNEDENVRAKRQATATA